MRYSIRAAVWPHMPARIIVFKTIDLYTGPRCRQQLEGIHYNITNRGPAFGTASTLE